MTQAISSNDLGRFYGVGVGPGDPELVTIKARRLLQSVGAICFTQLDDGRESYALGVVRDYLEGTKPELIRITVPSDDSPVSQGAWDNAALSIGGRLRQGQDVAFITEGDPMLYSEFSYLLDSVRAAVPEAATEVIPGVTSILAAASSSQVPLVTQGQRLAILPAVYGIDDLREAITNYDTIVLMEVNRTLLDALANLESLGLAGKAIYVRQATTPEEQVVQDIHQLSDEDLDYFSLLIIKR
ncbi:MAG: precorrin-2 C(20)-methyltransferase [SAR202 cluster bacterium Io17-Chloro-G9]|nr:MAG: precorrin-2 C(20)-methyltransferase [SAR202 cluster bacterium Io17-Chloro-G9]